MFLPKMMMDTVKAPPSSKFCPCLGLRKGAIMIAAIEMSLTAVALILIFLCVLNATRLLDMVTIDIKELENDVLRRKAEAAPPFAYALSNEEKMLLGQHLLHFLQMIVITIFLFGIFYFIASILLMYGAIRRSATHLLPWLTVAFISLLLAFVWFPPFCYFMTGDYCLTVLVFAVMFYPLELYSWMTVFSYYRQLTCKQFNQVEVDNVTADKTVNNYNVQ